MNTLKELDSNQALAYNKFIEEFNAYYKRNKHYMRGGQAFYNFGYKKGLYDDINPVLFYSEDAQEVRDIIEKDTMKYIKGIEA